MKHLTYAGITAGIAVTLTCANLTGSAAAPSWPTEAATTVRATALDSVVASRDATPDRSFDPVDRAQALAAGRSRSTSIAKSLGLGNAEGLRPTDVERDADGTVHIRYARTLGGLPVIGGDLIVHESAAGAIESADFASEYPLTLDTEVATKVSAATAAAVAARSGDAVGSTAHGSRKVVWAVDTTPRLAWLTRVRTTDDQGFPMPTAVVVDARTGEVIQSWPLHQAALGKGHALYSGRVRLTTRPLHNGFVLRDVRRGGSSTVDMHNMVDPDDGYAKGTVFRDADNRWGNGHPANRQSAAVDVAYGSATTWDFYKQKFHRNGIANDGRGTVSRVHYGSHYENAFWSDGCFCMTYGDGGKKFKPLVALDVAGHEMTHGVTSSTADLLYFGDMGGLNESTSDIFGTVVEFFAHNKHDEGDYLLGEEILKPGHGTFARRMDSPRRDGVSYNCWSPTMGLDDPHFTSGPGNHFFYLLAEGSGTEVINGVLHHSPACDGGPVQGIGRAKAGAIWYRALTRYFLSTTGYLEARDATIRAAIDLYGERSRECRQVVLAWDAVNVLIQDYTCDGVTDPGSPDAFGKRGGFERGRFWWGATGHAWVTKVGTLIEQPGQPRTGKWYGVAGMQGTGWSSRLMTDVTIPDSPAATLRFFMAIHASKHHDRQGDVVVDGSGTVDIVFRDNIHLARFDRTFANDTYQQWSIDVGDLAGQTGTLSMVVHENDPVREGAYFGALFDDFSLTPN